MDEKYKVIITPEAQEDIRNSIRYIARELANPQAAMALQEELRKEITSLETTSSRDPEIENPYWYGSTVLIENGFIYFIDDEDMTVDEINESYCYFKARHMKYHIIPD